MQRMKIIKSLFATIIFALGMAPCTRTADIDFTFFIPPMPSPPLISEVTNRPAINGSSSFYVQAKIEAQTKMLGRCDKVNRSDCTMTDWYPVPDPSVSPNPPDIRAAWVYYYINGDQANAKNVAMSYDARNDLWKANVPRDAKLMSGDSITYYLVAVDSLGNVASESPSVTEEPCSDIGTWDDDLATPMIDSCTQATSYEECGWRVPMAPGSCGTVSTMGDRFGDVCGEPDKLGIQSVINGSSTNKIDIMGITVGAGSRVICAKMGLGGPPPAVTGSPPLEIFVMFFYNPDLPDSNPVDPHVKNAFAITYSPEAVGSDPTLVKVLWDSNCVTDPITTDPLGCKLITAVGDHPDLKIGYQSSSIRFITKKSGTGSPYAVPYNLNGSSSNRTVVSGMTGEMNLSGGIPFWISDRTTAMSYYARHKTASVETDQELPSVQITKTSCSADGSVNGLKACPMHTPPSTSNTCRIDFLASDLSSLVDEYRIYRGTSSAASNALLIGTVPETGQANYLYSDVISRLDGDTYHYWLTSYNRNADRETRIVNAVHTSCRVEDVELPAPPVIIQAVTPKGSLGQCQVSWSIAVPDPSLAGFWVSRDGIPLNAHNPFLASSGVTRYDFTDPAALRFGTSYNYTVTAVDIGGNTAVSGPATCIPEDRKPPKRIADVIATNIAGNLGIHMEWEPAPREGFGGYNIYACTNDPCRDESDFKQLNQQLLNGTLFIMKNSNKPLTLSGDVYVYLEVCDDCVNAGTCPSQTEPNCTGFPTGGADSKLYVKKVTVSDVIDIVKPAFPQNVSCSTSPSGDGIEISWDRVCKSASGILFNDCNYSPVSGYKVAFVPSDQVPNSYISSELYPCESRILVNSQSTRAIHTNRACPGKDVPFDPNTTYCYNVFAVDGLAGISDNGPGGIMQKVCCNFNDTIPPASPIVSMDTKADSCAMSWQPVADSSPVIYSGYRCEGGGCNSASSWNVLFSNRSQSQGLSFEDTIPDPESRYTYCVTATDAAGNQSALTGLQPGCRICIPGTHAAAPANIQHVFSGDLIPRLYWTHSPDDQTALGSGYRIYRCTDDMCVTNKQVAGMNCDALAADSGAIRNLGPLTPVVLLAEPPGCWYYGVTFQTDCSDSNTESILVGNAAAISQDPNPDLCQPATPICEGLCVHVSNCNDYSNLTSACSPVSILNTNARSTDGTFLATPQSGFQVFLADAAGNRVGAVAATDQNGVFHLVVDNNTGAVNLQGKYRVVLVVPPDKKNGVPCDTSFSDSAGNCFVVLGKFENLTNSASRTNVVFGMNLPAPGGGRAEVGNANCDQSVDVSDMILLKSAFGAAQGDADYKTWLDFDGNGIIDMSDFMVLKKYYGNELDAAPSYDATLCKPD